MRYIMRVLIFCAMLSAAYADCSSVTCVTPTPVLCPEDSIPIRGTVPSGECCPTADRCECKAKCQNITCQPNFFVVFVSNGTGTPGTCCDQYRCKPNCINATCPTCPADSVQIRGTPGPTECCSSHDRCECPVCVTPSCQPGKISVLVSNGTGIPGSCCSKYECITDCSLVTCPKPAPLTCPGDSVLIRGTVPSRECCPTADRCECKAECANTTCRPNYLVVLVSNGTGTPGTCCSKYVCIPDCRNVTCATAPTLTCPGDSVLIRGTVPPGECCPTADRCECNPRSAIHTCSRGYISVFESTGSGTPGSCYDKYKCVPGCYTQWFDGDNPSGMGDLETLKDLKKGYPGKICPKPFLIQAMTLSGVPVEKTGQVIGMYDSASGFACVNSQQKRGTLCLDYKVRFGCRCPWPNKKPGDKSDETAEHSSDEKY